MPFSWSATGKPLVALAPMAGVTDASYRQLTKKIAPEAIVFTEFLSTDAIVCGAAKIIEMLSFDPAIERPFIVQVFGADPEHFLTACKVVEQMGADGIDINMGCPAAKIVSSCYGSALIRRPELAAEVVASAVRAVSIPVSVKTRLGWDSTDSLIPFCKKLEEAGACALSIHGRRYCDKFGGEADWEPMYELKRAVRIPVIGNGDIETVQDALDSIQNLDGVMVGRGTLGNPWLLRDISRAFAVWGRNIPIPQSEGCGVWLSSVSMSFEEKIPTILEHCELAVRHKGERRGILEMRRHLSGYVRGFDGAKELRMKLLQATRYEEVRGLLRV